MSEKMNFKSESLPSESEFVAGEGRRIRPEVMELLKDFISSETMHPDYKRTIEKKIFSFIVKIEDILERKFERGADIRESRLDEAVKELETAFNSLRVEKAALGNSDNFLKFIKTLYEAVMDVKYKNSKVLRDKALLVLWPLLEERITKDVFYMNRSNGRRSELRTDEISSRELSSSIASGVADYLAFWVNDSKLWNLSEKVNFTNNLRELMGKKDFVDLLKKIKRIKQSLGDEAFMDIWNREIELILTKSSDGHPEKRNALRLKVLAEEVLKNIKGVKYNINGTENIYH